MPRAFALPVSLLRVFRRAAASVDADALLDYFSDFARAMQEGESYSAAQLEAVRVLRDAMASARMVGPKSHGALRARACCGERFPNELRNGRGRRVHMRAFPCRNAR